MGLLTYLFLQDWLDIFLSRSVPMAPRPAACALLNPGNLVRNAESQAPPWIS